MLLPSFSESMVCSSYAVSFLCECTLLSVTRQLPSLAAQTLTATWHAQRKQALLALYFLIDPVLLPEGTSLPRGQKLSPKAKGPPLNDKAPLKVIAIYLQLLLPTADFPKGLNLAAVYLDGQAMMAAQLVQCLLVDQSVV